MQHDFLSHLIPFALILVSCDVDDISVTLIHSLGQEDQNEVQHDYFGHVMLLAPVLASCDADGIISQWHHWIS